MDRGGYESINVALREGDIRAVVSPRPAEGERVEYVTVCTAPDVVPAAVLNALAKASLLKHDGEDDACWRSGPQLDPVLGMPGSITFIDTNNHGRNG